MAVDETEDGVIERELNHDATLPAVAEHILHDIILAHVAKETTVVVFNKDNEEDLTLSHEINLDILFTEVLVNQTDFVFFL